MFIITFLFSIHAEMMMIESMEDVEEGVRVGRELLKDVKFADNQGMVSHTIRLQTIMSSMSKTGEEYNMKINVKKTKNFICKVRFNEPNILQ